MEPDITVLVCPRCHGFGFIRTPAGTHLTCTMCHNRDAVVMSHDDDVIVWHQPFQYSAVRIAKVRQWIEKILNVILIIIGIGGVVALWDVLYTITTEYLGIAIFFTGHSITRLIFWISILADLELYYRMKRALEKTRTITTPRRLQQVSTVPNQQLTWEWYQSSAHKFRIDASQYCQPAVHQAIQQAQQLAHRFQHHAVAPIHLLLAVLPNPDVMTVLFRLEVHLSDFTAACERIAQRSESQSIHLTESLLRAYCEARQNKRPTVSILEVLLGCVQADPLVQAALADQDITELQLRQVIHWGNVMTDVLQGEHRRRRLARSKPKSAMNRAMTARPTKILDSISQDFTLLARANRFLPAIGRDHEVAEAFRILQEGHSSVLLLGEPGVGKSTILEGIAELMTSEAVPEALQDKRLVVTDPGALIAGASDIGGLEQRMEQVISEMIQAGNVIWAIEDIHTLLGAGSTGSSIDIGKILMNAISQGYIQVISTSTVKEYQQFIEPQEAFARRFQLVQVSELAVNDAILVLEGRAPFVEGKYGVYFTFKALSACVTLTDRYIKDRHLPAKAVDVMDEAAILAREQAGKKTIVTQQQVAQVVAEKTNVSVTALTESETDKLLQLEEILHERVIGQGDAIAAIARALRRAREDVRDTARPIASLLFLGPTGVGKTETAKAIAASYFGDAKRLLRFDMSEYQTPDAIAKLIGSTGQPGLLTEAVRRTPFALVLLDELEKAHPEVLNIFLQVMDDGRLTDGLGRTTDFSNAMIIATSNAATGEIQIQYQNGQTSDQIQQDILEQGKLLQWFHPELLNRFDHIAVFTPLSPEELLQVGEILLTDLAAHMLTKGITLHWQPEAVVMLVQQGYNPQFGARPLRRLVQDMVQDGLAQLLLKEKIGRRDSIELQADGSLQLIKAERI